MMWNFTPIIFLAHYASFMSRWPLLRGQGGGWSTYPYLASTLYIYIYYFWIKKFVTRRHHFFTNLFIKKKLICKHIITDWAEDKIDHHFSIDFKYLPQIWISISRFRVGSHIIQNWINFQSVFLILSEM